MLGLHYPQLLNFLQLLILLYFVLVKNYLEQHPDKFQNEKGEYDDSKFMDYRLEQMKKAKDRVKYTMELTLTKKDKKWQMNALTEEQHQKLHGIYEY